MWIIGAALVLGGTGGYVGLSLGFVGIAEAATNGLRPSTNCDREPKPALECQTGYSIICIPAPGNHWGCGKESNGAIIEISSGGTVNVSSSNSSSITTEVEAEAGTGGNFVPSGGSVRSGSSKSSVSVTNSSGTDEDGTEIEIETERGVSSVKVKNTSVGASSSFRNDDDNDEDEDEDGIEIELEEEHGAFFLEINGEEVRLPGETGALKVEVRGWDSKEKKITITPREVRTESDLENFVKVIALNDDSIANISIATTTIELDYSHGARLFGLIPWTLTPTITIDDAGTATEVKVKFPWYHVFFKKGIDFSEVEEEFERANEEIKAKGNKINRIAATLQALSNILKTKHDTVKNSINNVR